MRCHSFCLFFIITFDCVWSRVIEQGCQKIIVCSYGSSVQIRFKATDQYYSTDAGKQIPGADKLTVYEDGTLGLIDSGNGLTGDEKIELKKYISNYFLVASSVPSACYPGSKMESGEYVNYSGNTIIYNDLGTSLSFQLKNGTKVVQVSGKYNYFPFCYNDGCFHFIESLLM